MAVRITNAAASAGAGDGTNAGIRAYIGATPKLILYTGNVNANNELAPAGTALCTVTMAAFGAASNGVISSTGGSNASSTGTGSATCFALFKSDGTTKVLDGTVAKTSGGDINFDENALTPGTVTIGTTTITLPPA